MIVTNLSYNFIEINIEEEKMNKIVISMAVTAVLTTVAFARGGYHGNFNQPNYNQNSGTTYLDYSVNSSVVAELTDVQKEDLLFMYEEEKLARDVYITLGDMWGASIFYNIQGAEQTHMSSLRTLLDKYSLTVPVMDDSVGVFENQELQALYNQLIEQGSVSLDEAINVGILVEETDIADLESKIVDTPSDIALVYQSLLNGSYNHLSAFTRNLGSSTLGYYRGGRR